jgi:hypothetical protein
MIIKQTITYLLASQDKATGKVEWNLKRPTTFDNLEDAQQKADKWNDGVGTGSLPTEDSPWTYIVVQVDTRYSALIPATEREPEFPRVCPHGTTETVDVRCRECNRERAQA